MNKDNWREFLNDGFCDASKFSDVSDIFSLCDSKKTIQLSKFPKKVPTEYDQKANYFEMFYQRVLDKETPLDRFRSDEKKIHDVLLTAWLYDDVYYYQGLKKDELKNNHYYKKNRKLFKSTLDEITYENEFSGNLILINDGRVLSSLLYVATRDISQIVLFFKKSKNIVFVSDCIITVYNQNGEYDILPLIAERNGLFLLS